MVSNAGPLSGLWDGFFAIFTLLADIFWNFEMYDRCSNSWWYDAGFLIGFVVFLAIFELGGVAIILFIIFFAVWALTIVIPVLFYAAVFAIVVILAIAAHQKYSGRKISNIP
ncbi:MAG: hypothetical protein WDZ93_02530 [Candidatus Paceibacterota bacterium]